MQNLTRGFLKQRRPAVRATGAGNRHACGSMILFWIIISMSWAFAAFAQADGRPFETLTAEEQVWLDQNPEKLTLVYNTTRQPVEFSSPEGEFKGMAADIVAGVEKRLNVVFIKQPSATWEGALSALEKGEVSLMPAIVRTGEREGFALFTTPYTVFPMVIIGRRNMKTGMTLDDLAGKQVAVVAGMAVEEYLRRRPNSRIQVIPMSLATLCLQATSLGQVDAFVENLGSAAYYIEKEGIVNLQVIGTTEYSYELSVGVSRRYPLLFSAVQKALADIPPAELNDIRKQWISLQAHTGMSAETKRLMALVAIFTALLLMGLGLISYALKRSLNEKIAILKTSQQSLLEHAELLHLATESTQAGIWDYRPGSQTIYLSEQWFTMLGYEPQSKKISMTEFETFIYPEDLPVVDHFIKGYLPDKGQEKFESELRLRRADATWCWVLSKGKAVDWDEKGRPTRIIGLDINIRNIKEAQEKITQSEARFSMLFKMAPLPMADISLDGRILEVNHNLTQTMGYALHDVPTLEHAWNLALPDPGMRNEVTQKWKADLERAISDHSDMEPFECPVRCMDGTLRAMVIATSLIKDSAIVSFFDITDRREKEMALQKNMELLRATFNATPDGILAVNKDLKVTHANSQFYKMWQIPPELQKTDDDETLREFVLDQLEDPEGFQGMTNTLYHSRVQNRRELLFKDGRAFDCYSAPMILEDEEIGRVWNFRDISDQKRAEKEREKLQSQLLQSQKLEAVGILAGGVAHDFNNMLGAIIGYAELTLDCMDAANPLQRNLSKILDAARRSTGITRQLLAFARKQTISPVVFDLNGSVEAILKMIRRLIGENIDLAWLPGVGRFMVKMDPSQLDQIILNLCVNARDAIGGVGRISIETDTVSFDEADCAFDSGISPGDYVLLLVSDTGCGMDKETLAHIFEPFFTTKGPGRGTGMGLATIYGIVQQNKGAIKVYSEPGTGTVFKIYIPMDTSGAEKENLKKNETFPLSRGETVLIVEDDSNFLEMTAMMLQNLGYSILSAQTPSEALCLARENPSEIHLFITDVIMPEMNGRQLAEQLSMIRPKIKHLFMSGYTADIIAHQGVLDEGINFIQKPFMLKDLAVKIRRILG